MKWKVTMRWQDDSTIQLYLKSIKEILSHYVKTFSQQPTAQEMQVGEEIYEKAKSDQAAALLSYLYRTFTGLLSYINITNDKEEFLRDAAPWVSKMVKALGGKDYPHLDIPCNLETYRALVETNALMPPNQEKAIEAQNKPLHATPEAKKQKFLAFQEACVKKSDSFSDRVVQAPNLPRTQQLG